jgi:hypothetical protein
MPGNDIWEKAVDLVGEEALRKLGRHGLVLADKGRIDKFLDEHRKSNDRLRAAAKASMEAVGLTTVRYEIVLGAGGGPVVIATFPNGDEEKACREAAEVLADTWSPPAGWKSRERVTPLRDTKDVDVVAEEDAEGHGPGDDCPKCETCGEAGPRQ